MKITSLTIGGFKGIKNKATIPLAPITLFFGANSTGKSTVLHALLYLYEVIAKRNFDAQYSSIAGEALYFGGFHNLVHGKHLDGVITLGATLDFRDGAADIWDDYLSEPERELVEEALNTSPDFEAEVLSFEIDIRWDKQKNSVFISRYESRVSDGLVFKSVATEGKHYISIPFFNPLVNSGINSVEFEQSEGLNILGGE
ncbi:AAA family ATPase, partial [Vibrio parahaemolyticus]